MTPHEQYPTRLVRTRSSESGGGEKQPGEPDSLGPRTSNGLTLRAATVRERFFGDLSESFSALPKHSLTVVPLFKKFPLALANNEELRSTPGADCSFTADDHIQKVLPCVARQRGRCEVDGCEVGEVVGGDGAGVQI